MNKKIKILTENGICYCYYAIVINRKDNILRYGILCKLIESGKISREIIPDITTSKDEIDKIIKLIYKNTVTPTILKDVISDYIGVN